MIHYLNISADRAKDPHKDIHLKMPLLNMECEVDSYYLLMDKSVKNEIEGFRKVLFILIEIIEGWKTKIESLESGSSDFLPFDFSDEYIGCMRIELSREGKLSIQYGYTQEIMGMEIYPSDVKNFIIENDDFTSTSKIVFCDKTEFIQNLDRCIQNFTSQIAKEL